MRARSTSLKDVAEALNVSYSLVSKVMGGRMGNTRARPEIIQAIHAKAKELDYHPHPLASALKRGHKGAVGVLIHPVGEEGSEIATRLLRGISTGLDTHKIRMWLRFYSSDEEFLHHFDKRARNEVDGVIVVGIPHQKTMEQIMELHDNGMPAITVFDGYQGNTLANVIADVKQQGFLATEHLILRGCRRLAHLVTGSTPNSNLRYKGFLEAHEKYGLVPDSSLAFVAKNYKLESGESSARHWLDQKSSFDGIVAQSDHQAIGAIHELLRHGIRVPDQVRVIGVDDSPLCQSSPVPLSSVTGEWTAVGALAAEKVVQEIIDHRPAESRLLIPRLIARMSSA
jgi:LacI family transcriptional regulator